MTLRWARRDLRARLPLVIALALVLAIGAGLFSTLGAMKAWRVASADGSFAALRAHDVRLSLDEGSFARTGRLAAVAGSVGDVEVARERLSVPVQLSLSPGGRAVLTAGRLVGMEPGRAAVDALAPSQGRTLRRADAGRPIAVLERSYGSYHELPSSGTVDVAGRRLTYVGHAMAPEWFVVAREGAVWGAEATYGVVFTSLETAQDVSGRSGAVNEVIVRLRDGTDPAVAARSLETAFARRLPERRVTATTLSEESAHRFLYGDAENDQRVFMVFALLILGGAALAAFNLLSRVVESQRREIGIGMALGVDPLKLAIRPLLLGLQVGVLGAALGIGVALGTAELFKPLLRDRLPLPVVETPFQTGAFVVGALLGLLTPLAAAALPVWRSVRVTPIEAIRVGFRVARGAGLAGRLRGIPLPGRSLGRMPVRNVLRTPRRTIMTALGIAAVISVVIAMGGMTDSFDATAGRATTDAERVTPDRVTVTLDGFRPAGSAAVRALAADPAVARAEPGLLVGGSVSAHGRSVDVALAVNDPDAQLWQPSIEAGDPPGHGAGLLLSARAADELGVGPGERVTLRHPVRTGTAALGEASLLASRLPASTAIPSARSRSPAPPGPSAWASPAPPTPWPSSPPPARRRTTSGARSPAGPASPPSSGPPHRAARCRRRWTSSRACCASAGSSRSRSPS